MASAYLGPERHRPLAVISESYQTRLSVACPGGGDGFSFGLEYEKKLQTLLDQHLELGTTDRLVYVGDARGSLAQTIADRFCLIHPVQTVIPGHFHYAETEDGYHVVPIRISHVGAEEFFRNLSEDELTDKPKYDRILVEDCVRYLAEPQATYKNMTASLTPDGKILIIHRPGELSTLPIFNDAKLRLTNSEIPYTDIIKDLQACRLDVSWELESLPVLMPKTKWLSMVKMKFPTQMEILSQLEIEAGIRELTEGVLKYEGDMVEFVDRLMFITATPCRQPATLPTLHRSGAELMTEPQETPLKLVMKLSPEKLRELRCKPEDDLLDTF
ncbi:unnamed protein product [Lymnaea stagnalis]|uniref:Uncharacterized protein n=1 Tax=Lymnaea stagnalis TaxID=6523 RepID=A0AAV2H9K5_LYMST